ncbi:MAG: PIN domain-containing protein [Caldilineaceae bacterium]
MALIESGKFAPKRQGKELASDAFAKQKLIEKELEKKTLVIMSEGTSVAAAAGQAYVLDACALLAFLGNEPGAHVVKSLLTDTSNVCMVHAINLCEVYYDLLRQNDAQFARERLQPWWLRYTSTERDGRTVLATSRQVKSKSGKISLADCFALALAIRSGATLVTSDHHEFDRIDALGICPILFIR